jgi:16S rRNA (cytosine1402-N4)-methyltransferase
MTFSHEPVLLAEVLEWLAPGPGRHFLDGTLGGGGHTEALLKAGASVVGLDRDPAALAAARARLSGYGDLFTSMHLDFGSMGELGVACFDGILLDLGVSSHQLDEAGRGFSFMRDGPLDMRMDPTRGVTAADLVASADEEAIVRWLRELGEEPRARVIARAIVRERARSPIVTTGRLAAVVESACGRGGRAHHPATRTFQALRLVVNDELGQLDRALDAAPGLLKAGGRLGVISFHSLEDRRVKRRMEEWTRKWEDTPVWPNSVPNPGRQFSKVTRRAVMAGEAEVARNPRSRSARLRVVERLGAGSAPAEGGVA